jgi:plasmid replication initiation protein
MAKKIQTLLPQLAGVSIHQSNKVTNAKYDFKLMQERVFTWLMYKMQDDIMLVANGKCQVKQLPLFENRDIVSYTIPLQYLGRPDQYQEIRQCVKDLATIAVEMKDTEHKMTTITGLFAAIHIPDQGTRSNKLTIDVRSDVAQMLMHIDTKFDDRKQKIVPKQYTTYDLRVANTCKNKYSSRIYKLLCSYRQAQYFRIDLQELRDMLMMQESNYKNYKDFKKRVIVPVQKELKKLGDIWFNCDDESFEIKNGKKVERLYFRLIEPSSTEAKANRRMHLNWILQTNFGFNQKQLDKIQANIMEDIDWKELTKKIEDIDNKYREKNKDERQALLTSILRKEYGPATNPF